MSEMEYLDPLEAGTHRDTILGRHRETILGRYRGGRHKITISTATQSFSIKEKQRYISKNTKRKNS